MNTNSTKKVLVTGGTVFMSYGLLDLKLYVQKKIEGRENTRI